LLGDKNATSLCSKNISTLLIMGGFCNFNFQLSNSHYCP
jgi:hypothetical protein